MFFVFRKIKLWRPLMIVLSVENSKYLSKIYIIVTSDFLKYYKDICSQLSQIKSKLIRSFSLSRYKCPCRKSHCTSKYINKYYHFTFS